MRQPVRTFVRILIAAVAILSLDRLEAQVYGLNGTVSSAGAGLAGATITLLDAATSAQLQQVATDGTGHYEFWVAPGTYNMTIAPPAGSGLMSAVVNGIVIVASDVVQDVVLVKPVNYYKVSGRVKTDEGYPIRVFMSWNGPGADNSNRYTASNEDGTYEFLNRQEGSGQSVQLYADSGTVRIPEGTSVLVGPQGSRSFDLTGDLVLPDIVVPTVFLRGDVTDANGVPIEGVSVSEWRGTQTDEKGFFSLSFMENVGSKRVTFTKDGSGFGVQQVQVEFLVSDKNLAVVLLIADSTKPVFISGPLLTQVKATSATVTWQTDEPAKGDVSWGGGIVAEAGYGTQHAVLLTDLTASTSYTVTVSATDRSRNGPTTASVTFTTASLPDTAPPVIVNGPTVSALTYASAAVEWETNEPSTTEIGGDLTASVAGYQSLHRVELTGLAAQTTYTIDASSSDVSGNGPTTRRISFTTLAAPDLTPPVITKGPWSTDVTASAATIQWETDEPANSGVSYNNGTAYGVLDDDALTQQHRVRMTGLQPSTQYNVTVSSKDAFDNGPTLSAPFAVTTLATDDTQPPVFVETPQVCNVNEQLIQLCFRTDEPASVVVTYGTSAVSLTQTEARSQLTQQHTVPINGLNAATTYFFRVTVRDQAGNERASEVISAATSAQGSSDTKPQFLVGPTVTYTGADRAVVEWEADRPCRGVVEYGTEKYDLQVSNGEYKPKQSIVITNLQPATTYQFRAWITDVNGKSEVGGV